MKSFLLRADATVQAVLLVPVLAMGLMIFPLLLMIPLGIWQVGSALIKGLAWRSRFHLTYFGLATVYCLALWAGFSGMVEVSFTFPFLQKMWSIGALGVFFVIVVPLVGAVKYWKVSHDDWEKRREEFV